MSYTLQKKIKDAELLLDDLYENPDFVDDAFIENVENNELEVVKRVALQRKDAAKIINNNSRESAFYRNIIKLVEKRQGQMAPRSRSRSRSHSRSRSPPPIQRATRPATRRAPSRQTFVTPSRSRSPVRRRSSGRRRSSSQSGSPAGTRRNNRGGGKKTRKRS
jgi:hypothetical protein